MNKIVTIAVLLCALFLAGNAYGATGWALGGEFAVNWVQSGYGGSGAALCVKFPQLPIMFGFSASFMTPMVVGVTADWWAYQGRLVGPVNIYIGPGAFLWLMTQSGPGDNGAIGFGLRIPIGLQIFIVPAAEIFLEPAIAIGLYPVLPSFSLQLGLGFRFWF